MDEAERNGKIHVGELYSPPRMSEEGAQLGLQGKEERPLTCKLDGTWQTLPTEGKCGGNSRRRSHWC